MKTVSLALLSALALVVSANGQSLENTTFTVGVGSLAGWTLIDNSPDQPLSPGTTWDNISDRARLLSGDGIWQTVAGYTAGAGDTIVFGFEARTEWNSPTLIVTLFADNDPAASLATLTLPFTGNFGSFAEYSLSHTFLATEAGKSVGIAFTVAGVAADDRWVQFDNVSVSVTPIPEPSAAALVVGVIGIGFALWHRRRRGA